LEISSSLGIFGIFGVGVDVVVVDVVVVVVVIVGSIVVLLLFFDLALTLVLVLVLEDLVLEGLILGDSKGEMDNGDGGLFDFSDEINEIVLE